MVAEQDKKEAWIKGQMDQVRLPPKLVPRDNYGTDGDLRILEKRQKEWLAMRESEIRADAEMRFGVVYVSVKEDDPKESPKEIQKPKRRGRPKKKVEDE